MAKKLKYFLDHPQIKRAKSPGNGKTPEVDVKHIEQRENSKKKDDKKD